MEVSGLGWAHVPVEGKLGAWGDAQDDVAAALAYAAEVIDEDQVVLR